MSKESAPDSEWIERLTIIDLDIADVKARLEELLEDMRHQENVERVGAEWGS